MPVTGKGEIVMLYQYRHPVNEWCWEVPAGGMYSGATAIDTAKAELSEEIGADIADLEEVGNFYLSNGSSNQKGHVYIAWGAEPGRTRHEDTEMMDVREVPLEEAMRMARKGEISDGPSALALLICESLIRARLNQSRSD